ncbi:paladin isoform X4 [Camellia sinensis]|uniref:paladin isoform X4 n=1 Tax=Camellia sinensis TaxID=4442 RepID=UPI001035CBC9|nr:paladin isoform X4 [Camellia sinensis]
MSIPKEPEQVMKQRGGSVLGKKTILKSDHFPGCQNKRLSPQIDGAPNYRQSHGSNDPNFCSPPPEFCPLNLSVVSNEVIPLTKAPNKNNLTFLTKAPMHVRSDPGWRLTRCMSMVLQFPQLTASGMFLTTLGLKWMGSKHEFFGLTFARSRRWYILMVALLFYVMWRGPSPILNIRDRVEQMEARLKEDILLEAARYGNKILVTDELPDGQMVDQWEPVTRDSVKTPLEVYEELQAKRYLVDYERVPVTDEKSPKEQDFDILVNKISQADINTEIIFNCQMGRGRTTTGMVIATLVYLNRIGASGIPRTNSIGKVSNSGSSVTDIFPNSEEAIRRGEYAVIRSLIRVLEGGVEGKRQVDKVIDKCASMQLQNLREAIATYRNRILHQPDEMKREASLSFFVEYLERYYFLICFAVYLHTKRAALHPRSPDQSSFADWMKARPELYSIIRRLLRRDPMGALGYANANANAKSKITRIVESADGRPCEMSVVAALRNGEVLGSQTVLKSDHCPGCQNPNLPERVEGAPNFREIPGFPVYGVANPTIDGIRSVIQRIGSSKGGRPVFWHNMREEPVIYINGKPFVLREVERPYKNMLEYTGIDRERVQRMEARLKEDILREAERYGGAIMVIHETDDRQIFDAWEHVSSDVIQTPLEVFRCLESKGFPVKYARVPITDGKAPKSSDFDTLAMNIASAPKDTAFVFNCQMGRGRTTTGTVIACLLKLRIDYGRPIRILLDDTAHEEVDGGTSSGEETGGHSASFTSVSTKGRHRKEPSHAFGINDILLLWKITRLFDNGVECREALDVIIDRCSALQNIRQAVLQYRKRFNQQHVEPRERRLALNRGAEYLERYFRLIAFAAYLGSEAFDGFCGQGESRMTFKNWLYQRPEVQAMKWSIRLRPGRFFTVPEELRAPHESQHGDAVMEAIVKTRNGSVLGKGSILKMYFFPGQRTSSNIQIHGAPHVYKVDGYPVYSMATPTISGAKEMLAYLGAQPTAEGSITKKVILTDLREEAVVYINGIPFVLRELNKPVDTLKHVGITGPVVEHMEARLKEDIISEVKQSGGRMLLHREEFSPASNQASVIGYWENIFVDDLKTPAEVYAALKDEGYSIEYRRIPLTRERDALASDVDAIQYCRDDSAGSYLFVSHTGFGGVAYAMAIICVRLDADAKLASQTPHSPVLLHQASDIEAQEMGDYRDILSLTRVLVCGPKSKADVDVIIERCAGAGHLRDDIFCYSKELENFLDGDDEYQAYLMDMGTKALRRYFFLITFRSYLYCTSATEMQFSSWMDARPELGHLCNNLRIVK